ncbi:MAG TPA: ferritin-like domain-containing protein [Ktedonobacteraceae bacterium]
MTDIFSLTHTGKYALSNATPRRLFLRRALASAAVIVPTGLLAACGSSNGDTTNAAISATGQPTMAITGTALSQTATTVTQPGGGSKVLFTEMMNDENEHVQFLQGALKNAARPRPTFQKLEQTDTQAFVSMAGQLENLGVGAYLMAIPTLTSKNTMLTAGSMLTIEARHAGFLNGLQQKPLSANGAFDKALNQADIASALSPFIASLNGGTDPAAKLNNDEDALNLALLLEFLEAEFYKLNLTRLFP